MVTTRAAATKSSRARGAGSAAAPCTGGFSRRSTLRSPSSPIHEEDEEKLSEDSDSQPVLSGGELVLRETSSPEVSVLC